MRLGKWLIVSAGLLMLWGCYHSASPVEPVMGESMYSAGDAEAKQHSLVGLYTFVCHPEAGAVDVITLRDADFHLNALKFLEPPPLVYLTIEGKPEFNENILDVDIGLTHPFIGQDVYTVFDVCGIVFTHGSVTGFNDPDVMMAGEGDTRLLNADGYTRWWNPAEFPHGKTMFNYIDGLLGNPANTADFNCTVNGYKYFADGLEKDEPLTALTPEERGVFSAVAKNIRHYTIDLSGGLIFNYAVDACWKFPQGKPPYDVPDDFPPGANRHEAWNVSVYQIKNELFYEETTGSAGGDMQLLIDVWDHYGAGLNKVYAESLAGLPLIAAPSPVDGGEGYSTYELDFTGENLTRNGEAELLITVESEKTGYGDTLPTIPIYAYFKHTFNIRNPLGWARTWGPGGGLGAAVDGSGNAYVTGKFLGTVDFDPSPEVDEHTSNGHDDIFLCKFYPSGDLQWAHTWGGSGWDIGLSVAADGSGNGYVTGWFVGPVDFNPGPGVDEHTSNGYKNAFLSKFPPDGDW